MELKIENVSKSFGENKVLKNITLNLSGRNIYGIIGRNGSGKSVLLKIICGFYAPDDGMVLFNGDNYIERNSFPENTRALIEKPSFISDLTGLENLELLAAVQNKIGKKEIEEVIEKLNLKKEANKKYGKYSQGTKQKLGIAQVLMEDPSLIILDEPFNGVEKETAAKIRTLLKEEKEKDKIIIIASHIKEDIIDFADVIFEIDGGKISKKQNQ